MEKNTTKDIQCKSIKLTVKTYRDLAKLGTLNDTFDSVIAELIQKSANVKSEVQVALCNEQGTDCNQMP